jgi:hypothetical protein
MTSAVRSPFFIIHEACSPMQCEQIADSAEFIQLDTDRSGKPTMTVKHTELAHALLTQALHEHQEAIEAHYQAGIQHLEPTRVQWADGTVTPVPVCDNSTRIKDKWLRVHNRDLTALLFLSDYNDKPPFDTEFEVYGGKIEFPSHGFGFNPVRGTMIIYPSDPHFTHVFSPIGMGELFISKTFIQLDPPLLYSPKNFPGTWRQWLDQSI